jgi:hypothetical protein
MTIEHSERFFFTDEALILFNSFTRTDFLTYLMHCRGYNPKHGCSTSGARRALLSLGIPERGYRDAMRTLERRGLVRRGGKRGLCPSTQLPPIPPAPSPPAGSLDEEQLLHRRHDYLAEHGAGLIRMPWSLLDDGAEPISPSLRSLGTAVGVRMLLACYQCAADREYLPADLAIATGGKLLLRARAALPLDEAEREEGWADIVDSGLMRESDFHPGLVAFRHAMLPPVWDVVSDKN